MKRIETEILIQADAATVWAVLTDFSAHATWDPFLTSIAGDTNVGARLEVRFASGETFRPIVTEVRVGRVFEWLGTLGAGWIFSGRHRFELLSDRAATRFVHSETFTGVLVPFLGRTLRKAESGFSALNVALKARAEGRTDGTEARPHA